MASLPSDRLQITRSNAVAEREINALPTSNAERQASGDKDAAKTESLEFLKRAADTLKQVDGRCRFAKAENSNEVAAVPRWVAFFQPNQVVEANKTMHKKLKALEDLEMGKEDKVVVKAILWKMKCNDVAGHDIVKLNRLVNRLDNSRELGSANSAYKSLESYAKQMRNSAPGMSITWSDKKASIQIRDKFLTADGRKEAGQWLAAIFMPLREELDANAGADCGKALRQFDDLMALLKKGDMKSHELVELFEVVKRGKDPVQYALNELNRLGPMAIQAGDNESITWRDNQHDFKITNRRWMTEPGRKDAAGRLGDRLSGLQQLFPENKEATSQIAMLLNTLRSGEGKSTHVADLYRLVKQVPLLATQKAFDKAHPHINDAVNTLNELAQQKAPQTGKTVADKLRVLKSIVSNHSPEECDQFDQLLGRIDTEQATKNDLITLRELVRIARTKQLQQTLQKVVLSDAPPYGVDGNDTGDGTDFGNKANVPTRPRTILSYGNVNEFSDAGTFQAKPAQNDSNKVESQQD